METSTERHHRWAPKALAALLVTSGVVHLVRPRVFEPLIPSAFPNATEIVYVSGVVELVCAAGLLTRQRWAGPVSVAVLLAVWPGNLQMAITTTQEAGISSPRAIATWLRMPLQIPLMWMAMQDRSSRSRGSAPSKAVDG